MATATAPPLSLYAVLSESKRIINAHSRHFLALSVIFLLPLSFSIIVSPTLFQLFSRSLSPNTSHIHVLLRATTSHFTHHHHHNPNNPIDPSTLLFPLLFSLFLLILSLCAISSITRSVLHGFFGRPVKLPSALSSILSSFLPLLSTSIISHLILFSLSLIFSLPVFLLFKQPLPHLLSYPLSTLLILLLLIFFLYLRVSWTLASVIVVAESTWGLHPLRRSASLMVGMKPVGFSALFFFGILEGVLLWGSSVLVLGSDANGGWWKDWAFVVQIVLTSTMLMLLMLYNAAANAVLYMYCKAVHGELAVEILEEFATEYVSLPFDEGKVPHLVSVVHV